MKYFITLFLILHMMVANSQKTEIVYVGDPMCSWCYGISNELQNLQDKLDHVEMTIIVGGLRNGGGDKWDTSFTDFLKHHWEEVESKSGMPFNYDLLSWKAFDYDTEPACRAIVTAKKIAPEKTWAFFKATQKGFYFDNKDPKTVEFYRTICNDLDIDFTRFSIVFESADIKKTTLQEFQYAQKIGATGFPSVYLMENGQLIKIGAGYTTADQILERINSRK